MGLGHRNNKPCKAWHYCFSMGRMYRVPKLFGLISKSLIITVCHFWLRSIYALKVDLLVQGFWNTLGRTRMFCPN